MKEKLPCYNEELSEPNQNQFCATILSQILAFYRLGTQYNSLMAMVTRLSKFWKPPPPEKKNEKREKGHDSLDLRSMHETF